MQATSGDMARVAGEFDRINGEITSTLKTLMSNLSMLQGTWKGLAAAQFETVKTQYYEDLTNLNKALGDTAESIRVSGIGYDTTDSDAAARVTQSGGGGISLPL